jgi:hypothetical protein
MKSVLSIEHTARALYRTSCVCWIMWKNNTSSGRLLHGYKSRNSHPASYECSFTQQTLIVQAGLTSYVVTTVTCVLDSSYEKKKRSIYFRGSNKEFKGLYGKDRNFGKHFGKRNMHRKITFKRSKEEYSMSTDMRERFQRCFTNKIRSVLLLRSLINLNYALTWCFIVRTKTTKWSDSLVFRAC